MLIKVAILIIVVIFFALNMGGANFAASFGAAYGSNIIKRRKAILLFSLFVILGALWLGKFVSNTLSKGIIPQQTIDFNVSLAIFLSASLTLFLSNLLKVPQSTSLVTVGAIVGAGLYFGQLHLHSFLFLIPMWILLPVIGYGLTLYLGRYFYPPRNGNFRLYEKIITHEKKLKTFVLISSCYNAFAVGTNNVANAVGPLWGAGIMNQLSGFLLIAPLFGIGGMLFKRSIQITGKGVVPLGIFTAVLVCFITSTLMIIASALGVPQSSVHLKMASIFAISSLKNGPRFTIKQSITKKTIITWLISPLLAIISSFLLLKGIIK